MRLANGPLFRAIITSGRVAEPLLRSYKAASHNKIHLIPNLTLVPARHWDPVPRGDFRRGARFDLNVGLLGNLGYTHCPRMVFEAAQILARRENVHFPLSGCGAAWRKLPKLKATKKLANVPFIERGTESELADFLPSANVWIIANCAGIAGVSITGRFLAVGRPIMIAAGRKLEAALVLCEIEIGWVALPEDLLHLAEAVRNVGGIVLGRLRRAAVHIASVAQKSFATIALARHWQPILSAKNRQ